MSDTPELPTLITVRHPTMRDADMPILDRIEAAIERITRGNGLMRVPAEATDPDIVLSDCRITIESQAAALASQAEKHAAELAGLEAVRAEQATGREYWCNEAQRLTAERDALRADAERYRWLRPRLVGADWDWNGEGLSVALFRWPESAHVSADCDESIDSALAALAARAQGGTP